MDLEERLWTIEELFWKGDSDSTGITSPLTA